MKNENLVPGQQETVLFKLKLLNCKQIIIVDILSRILRNRLENYDLFKNIFKNNLFRLVFRIYRIVSLLIFISLIIERIKLLLEKYNLTLDRVTTYLAQGGDLNVVRTQLTTILSTLNFNFMGNSCDLNRHRDYFITQYLVTIDFNRFKGKLTFLLNCRNLINIIQQSSLLTNYVLGDSFMNGVGDSFMNGANTLFLKVTTLILRIRVPNLNIMNQFNNITNGVNNGLTNVRTRIQNIRIRVRTRVRNIRTGVRTRVSNLSTKFRAIRRVINLYFINN
jgi:hypothetical protein